MSDMSKFESLDKIYAIETLSKLDCAVMAYGDWQNASDEELEEAEEAAAELLKLRKIAAAAEKMAERFEGSYNKGDEEVLAEYNEAISD